MNGYLDRVLGQLRDRYELCFVRMHLPPRDRRQGKGHALHEGGKELMALMGRHRVSAAFAGHIHSYMEDEMAGVPVIISGGAGSDLQEPTTDSYHYLLCTVQPGGSFRLDKIDVEPLPKADGWEYGMYVKAPRALPIVATVLCVIAAGLVVVDRRRSAARRKH